MSTVRYVGHGVGLEDGTVRLRRKVEFGGDAARRCKPAAEGPWPGQRHVSGPCPLVVTGVARC